MASCCEPTGYAQVFDAAEARANARAYRKNGLDGTARRMVEQLTSRGVAGASVLEVGGGIGTIQLELLRAGAARTTNVDLSPAYETVARELLEQTGLAGRVERHIADFAQEPERFGPADVVIMHRVVCCYPDMPRLVGAAADRARRALAMSFPRDAWWTRLGLQGENLWMWLQGHHFRAYLHAPSAIVAVAEAHGLRAVDVRRGWIWQSVILERED